MTPPPLAEPRTSTMRLRRITVTCEHRGANSETDAQIFAAKLAISHGWTTASSLSSTCGCISLFRTKADLLAHVEGLGIPRSVLGAPVRAGSGWVH